MKRTCVYANIPNKIHEQYKKSCRKLGCTMRAPLIKAVNAVIKEACQLSDEDCVEK